MGEGTSINGPPPRSNLMGHAHVMSPIDLRQRLKRAQQLANQIMFVRERVFCEVAPIAIASSPRLRRGYNGRQAVNRDL
jgi:hypothetical protein